MKLTLAEPKYLKESISIISELVNEARFKITPDAIELTAMDPANVALVVFKLFSSSFVEYDVKKDVEMAINLNNLKQILKRAKPNDMCSLEVSTNELKLQLKSNTTRTFSLPIIEFEEKEQRVPELSFPLTIKTDATVLSEAIEDASIVAESVTFETEPSKFTISAEGDLSQAKIEIKPGEETKIVSDSSSKIRAKYSVEYLKKMMSGSKLSDQVTIQYNKDYPLRLEYKTVDRVLLVFILAPRVENE